MRPLPGRQSLARPAPNGGSPPNLEPPTLATLDDKALLALLLGRCLTPSDTDRVAEALIDRFGSLGDIAAAEIAELGGVTGLGPRALLDLKLLRELSVRLAQSKARARPVLSSWGALVAYVRTALAHLPREQFRALYLDRRNVLLRDELVADGTVDHAPVYNAGPARVARLGRVPEIQETRLYVATVIECYLALSAGRSVDSARQCAAREPPP